MTTLITIIVIPLFLIAAYWAIDFVLWYTSGEVHTARIEGFTKQKDKGAFLPIVSYEDERAQEHQSPVQRIDQMIYLLTPVKKGDFTTIIVRHLDQAAEGSAMQIRVYGYIYILGAILSTLLGFSLLSWAFGSLDSVLRGLYVLIFLLLIVGAMAFMKFIQTREEV